jgi:TldD protein
MSPSAALLSKELPSLTYSVSHDRFDESWRSPLSTLLGLGRAAGADFVEFFLERVNYISCLAEDDAITSLSPRLATGAGVRVFKGQADCYVSTNDLSFAGLKKTLEKALSIMGLTLPGEMSYVPDINLEPLRDYATARNKNSWLENCSSMREMSEVLLAANAHLAKKAQHVQSRRATYFRDWQEILVAASDGVFARDIRLTQSVGFNLLCEENGDRASIGKRVGATYRPDFLRTWDYAVDADDVSESAAQMLHAEFVESGTYPVVMANEFGGVIFHEACGHLLETTQIERKTTPFADKKGEKIAHENLTAWDEGLTDNAFGTIDMDDEGMPVQRTLLIENGILKNFLSDRAGAWRTGQPRTGSGRRQGYTYAAASRMRNTYIAPGTFTNDEIFGSIERAFTVKKWAAAALEPQGNSTLRSMKPTSLKTAKLLNRSKVQP